MTTKKQTAVIHAVLPTEMLERIFWLLPRRDLKTAVLVCRRWRQVGEAPTLWLWVTLPDIKRRNRTQIVNMLWSQRMQGLRRLVVWQVTENILKAIIHHPGLKQLILLGDLSSVDPELLARVVVKMEDVIIRSMRTKEQVRRDLKLWRDRDFDTFIQECKLSRLNIENTVCTSKIHQKTLSSAVFKMDVLDLDHLKLTNKHVDAILVAINGEKSKTRKLSLKGDKLSGVAPQILAVAVAKVEELDVNSTDLTCRQIEAIFTTLAEENSNLRVLLITDSMDGYFDVWGGGVWHPVDCGCVDCDG